MHAHFTSGRRTIQFDMPLEAFLAAPTLAATAKARLCCPEDLLLDCLPADLDLEDDGDLAAALEQACLLATDQAVTNVTVSPQDLQFIRQDFIPGLRFQLAGSELGPKVA
jgi:hypothetical protein